MIKLLYMFYLITMSLPTCGNIAGEWWTHVWRLESARSRTENPSYSKSITIPLLEPAKKMRKIKYYFKRAVSLKKGKFPTTEDVTFDWNNKVVPKVSHLLLKKPTDLLTYIY